MSLRHRIVTTTALLLTLVGSAAHATFYTITDYTDINGDDDVCTLREAIDAISRRKPVGGCEAGSGGDIITLPEPASAADVYQLTVLGGGQITIGDQFTDPVSYDGDLDYTESFLVLDGSDLESPSTVFYPYDDEDLVRESVRGEDLNDDGDKGDTFVLEDEIEGINPNGDSDFNDLYIKVTEKPPEEIFVSPTIRVEREDAFDTDPKENPVIRAAAGQRIFDITEKNTVTLRGVTLMGNGQVTGDGGLANVVGGLSLQEDALLSSGMASGEGGAVFLSANGAANFSDASFIGNQAGGNGGVFGTDPAFDGSISGSRSYFEANSAVGNGGTIALFGDFAVMQLTTSTLYANSAAEGAAVYLAADSRIVSLNNVTIAGNEGGGAISFAATVGAVVDSISNSVVVGNIGGTCVGDATAIDDANIAYVVHEGNSCGAMLDGEALIQDRSGLPGDVISNGSNLADFTVLFGNTNPTAGVGSEVYGECPAGLGKDVCAPQKLVKGIASFRPDLTDSIGDLTDGVPTAVNAGSPTDATSNVCSSSDQRNVQRDDTCDAGSFELTIAKGEFDEFSARPAVDEVVDVAANDIGDMVLSCPTQDCVTIDIPPRKGMATVEYIDADDVPGPEYPMVRYTSDEGIHGVDSFHYIISKSAFGDGITFADTDVGAQVNMVIAPDSGARSESIGSFGLASALILMLLGCMRRFSVRAALVFMFSTPAMAAEIRVNDLGDSLTPIYNDGLCTLREALGNAIDGAPLISPDCTAGATGRDTILITLDGPINLAGPLVVQSGAVDIEGRGAVVPLVTGTTIDAGGTDRILIADSSTTLRDLTLTGGYSANRGGGIFTSASLTLERVIMTNNQALSGGAIYLNFNSSSSRSVKLLHSEFSNNVATGTGASGGVLYSTGQNQSMNITVDGSTFINNTAATTGGVMDVNLASGSSLNIANATFANNVATSGDVNGSQADALDLYGVSAGARVYINNSTFVNHPTGAFDMRDDINYDSNDPDFVVDDGYELVEISVGNSVFLDSGRCAPPMPAVNPPYSGQLYVSQSNVFAPYDASCSATSANDVETGTSNANVSLTLNGGALVPAAGEKEDFIPSHFPLLPGTAAEAVLIDDGNGEPGELVEGFGTVRFCRQDDLRGVTRSAGNQCDIGAYEVARITAVDDSGERGTNRDRIAIIDVLANDTTEGSETIPTNTIDLDPLTPGYQLLVDPLPAQPGYPADAKVQVVLRDDTTQECDTAIPTDDCVVLYTAPTNISCTDIKGFEDSFDYTFYSDPSDTQAVAGTVTVIMDNVKPQADDITVRTEPGTTVVFPFIVDDADAEVGTYVTDFKLSVKPINAKFVVVDGDFVYLGVGIVVDPIGGTVTYYPDNADQPFDERFTLTYKDDCGGSGSTTFIIDYPENGASGAFIGGGSLAGLLWWLPALLLRRRRSN